MVRTSEILHRPEFASLFSVAVTNLAARRGRCCAWLAHLSIELVLLVPNKKYEPMIFIHIN